MLRPVIGSHRWTLRAGVWWMVLALALTSPVTATAATALPAQAMTLLGIYGGPMNTVTVEGNHAFIGQGGVVVIMAVSDPTQPQRIGHSDFLPGDVKAIAVDQGYAYAALGYGGLAVLDVSNLAAPRLLTIVDTLGSAEDVAVVGTSVLVASGLAGLRIFDMSDPAQPTPLGAVNTPGFTTQVVVDGNTAFLADGIGGLRIVDITTPAAPVELGFFESPESITGVAHKDNFAYIVSSGTSYLRAIDVADPAHPSQESLVTLEYSVESILVAGDHLYLRANGSEIVILNSDPFLLNHVGDYYLGFPLADIAVAGEYAFVAGSVNGLYVLDINPPADTVLVAQAPSLNHVNRVTVHNNLAYVPGDAPGMAVLDVSQPIQIRSTTHLNPCIQDGLEGLSQVTVAGNTVVIDAIQLSWDWQHLPVGRQLCFYSLTDPLVPQWFGVRYAALNDGFSPRVAAQGNRLYVAEANNGLTILDAANPLGEPLGVYSSAPVGIYSVATLPTGDRLLAVTGNSIRLLDVSTPVEPQLLGELGGPYSSSVNGSGDLAFAYNVATKSLDIIDFQLPESPQLLASIKLPGDNAKRIEPLGNLVVVANGSAGVRIIDVSTPSAPKEVAFYDPPADVSGLAVAGNRVYVAANNIGLLVLQLDEDLLPQPSTLVLPLLMR